MAVYQISKIQVRRGLLSDLPQLSSGELGWAIDTQQLYIGNGSVSEGAAQVGNTKILTEKDISSSLSQNIEHIYKFSTSGSTIQTGRTLNEPISRPLQSKLDDTVFTTDFGTFGNGISDDTSAFRRSLNELFDNAIASSNTTPDGVKTRVILSIPAGIYIIKDNINIPSYATIIGAGIDKTIIQHEGSDSLFSSTNASNIIMRDLTIKSVSASNGSVIAGIELTNTSNCEFTNIKLTGAWQTSQFNTMRSKAILLNEGSNNNKFNNIRIDHFWSGIYAIDTVAHNTFNTGIILDGGFGVVIGSALGAPTHNIISNYQFTNIIGNAIDLTDGTFNHIDNCSMTNVANLFNANGTFPQIYIAKATNTCTNIRSDRHETATSLNYVPVVAGICEYTSQTYKVSLPTLNAETAAFYLPLNCSHVGGTEDSIVVYNIPYSLRAETFTRIGTLTVSYVDSDVSLSDDYTCSGDSDDSTAFEFSAAVDQINKVLTVYYFNTVSTLYRDMIYHYTAIL